MKIIITFLILHFSHLFFNGIRNAFKIKLNPFSYHPFLRRDFLQFVRKVGNLLRRDNSIAPTANISLRNMEGEELAMDHLEETRKHFQQLNASWEA